MSLTMETPQKYAIRRVYRKPDGQVGVKFTDTATGLDVADPNGQGYQIIQSTGFMSLEDLGISPVQTPDEPQISRQIIEEIPRYEGSGSDGNQNYTGSSVDRNPSNNYGFIERPGFMNFTNMVPGTIGTLSRVASLGMNVNNQIAANTARQAIGLPDQQNTGGFIGGIVGGVRDAIGAARNKTGYIADIQYDDGQGRTRTTPVSLSARDPVGRTTLTPNEARMRNMLNPVDVATRQETRQARRDFRDEQKAAGSNRPATGVVGAVAGIFDGVRSVTASIMDAVTGNSRNNTPSPSSNYNASPNFDGTSSAGRNTGAGASNAGNVGYGYGYGDYGAGNSGSSSSGNSSSGNNSSSSGGLGGWDGW